MEKVRIQLREFYSLTHSQNRPPSLQYSNSYRLSQISIYLSSILPFLPLFSLFFLLLFTSILRASPVDFARFPCKIPVHFPIFISMDFSCVEFIFPLRFPSDVRVFEASQLASGDRRKLIAVLWTFGYLIALLMSDALPLPDMVVAYSPPSSLCSFMLTSHLSCLMTLRRCVFE